MPARITKGVVNIAKPTRLGDLWVLVEQLPNRRAYVHITEARDAMPSVTQRKNRLTLREPEV